MKLAVGIVAVPALAIPAAKFMLVVVVTVLELKDPPAPMVTKPVKVVAAALLLSTKAPSTVVAPAEKVPVVLMVPACPLGTL